MQEPYAEGPATHGGPESCAGARKGVGEALTGAQAGRVSSRENSVSGVPTVWTCRKATRVDTLARESIGPHAVVDLVHACDAPRTGTGRSQGRLVEEGRRVRAGKSEDAILR